MSTNLTAIQTENINTAFYEDVIHGLSQKQKTIPCKWFYDENGSHLFEEITQTEEYYLTRVEANMLSVVAKALDQQRPPFRAIIEPGSGSSEKTRILLSTMTELSHYVPMDISSQFLHGVANLLNEEYPSLNVFPVASDFTHLISAKLPAELPKEQLVFFPGSTIGNFSPSAAQRLLQSFHHLAGQDGYLLIGIDGTQTKEKLLAAYNDKAGITAKFNLNLLVRANHELGANFDLNGFQHAIRWLPEQHRIEMHLRSKCDQSVMIGTHTFEFKSGETIFTESCYKYPQPIFESLAKAADWRLINVWHDQDDSDFQLFLLRANKP